MSVRFRRRGAFVQIGLVAILFTLAANRVVGWETDVHYALTYWLAMKAGFKPADALAIAKAAQEPDNGYTRPAPEAVILSIATNDDATLKQVQKYHFPSDVNAYFGPPNKRTVQAGSTDARYLVDLILNAKPSPETYAQDLKNLGDALHPFQDSWSHQGETDLPLRPAKPIVPNKMWSHSQTRGGWDRHDADLTSLYVNSAMETAFQTWQVLDRFAASRLGPTRKSVDWKALQQDVNEFVKADNKKAKLASLTKFGIPLAEAQQISDGLSAPGSVLPATVRLAIRLLAKSQAAADKVPPQATELFRRVLNDWLSAPNPALAMANIDVNSIAQQLTAEGGGLAGIDPALWCRKFLTMWRVADHGLVNQLGHGNPRAAGYVNLPTAPPTEGALVARSPSAAVQLSAGMVFPVDPEVAGVLNAFGVAVSFPQMPQDLVLVVVAPNAANQWRVVRLLTMVS